MFLIIELLFIVLLAMVLLMLYKAEHFSTNNLRPQARVEEYWDGRDRREHIRFKRDLDVTYIVEKRTHLKANGKSVDISEGGLKLLLSEKLAKGTLMDLIIELPGSKEMIEVEGEVAWSEEAKVKDDSGKRYFHSGVKFSAIKEPSGRGLVDYINSLASDKAS